MENRQEVFGSAATVTAAGAIFAVVALCALGTDVESMIDVHWGIGNVRLARAARAATPRRRVAQHSFRQLVLVESPVRRGRGGRLASPHHPDHWMHWTGRRRRSQVKQ